MKGLALTFSAPLSGEKDEILNLISLFSTFTGDLGILVSSVMFRPVLMNHLKNHSFEWLKVPF